MALSLTYQNNTATETTAQLYYSATFILPDNAYGMTYSGYIGNTQVNSNFNFGYVTVSSLQRGTSNKIEGNIKCTYYYDVTITTDSGSFTTTYKDTTYSGLGSETVYTHPGEFHFDAHSGQTEPNHSHSIIANVLTTENVNKWISYVDKAYCWKNQNSNGYSSISNLQVPDNKVITHTWYNNCAAALRGLGKTINNIAQNSLITANAINLLDFNGVKP